jgi:hypothetical protein
LNRAPIANSAAKICIRAEIVIAVGKEAGLTQEVSKGAAYANAVPI